MNPFVEPIIQTLTNIKTLQFRGGQFLPSIIVAIILLFVTGILIILFPSGFIPVIASFFICNLEVKVESLKTNMGNLLPSSIEIAVYFVLSAIFMILSIPFYILSLLVVSISELIKYLLR